MAAYLSPVCNEPMVDANGDPLSGGKVYTYLAGTSTPAVTYTDSTGVTPQANPVILNSRGVPASPIWLGAGVAMKIVVKTSADVTLAPTYDNILGVNDPSGVTAQDQWVAFSGTPTYINATSFSVAGDQTGAFQVLRRVKTTNSGGTVYSSISVSSFGAGVTAVTVVNDSGTLDSGLSSVSYGLLSATNPSIPETTMGKGFREAVSAATLRSTLGFTSSVIDRAYAEYTANANLSTIIPLDDTIPQNTEGTQIISVSFTPKSATNRLRLRFQGQVAASTGPMQASAAIFSSASANALAASHVTMPTTDYGLSLVCEVEYVPGVTTALTFSVRVGPPSAANIRLNGNSSGRYFGGASHATLVIEELTA